MTFSRPKRNNREGHDFSRAESQSQEVRLQPLSRQQYPALAKEARAVHPQM